MTCARILLADDHDLFREGLTSLINAQPELSVVGQAEDGLAALSLAHELRPDLIVMDIQMPVCDGLEATRLIRAEWPEARIVILTVHDEDEKLFEAIKAGATGYLLKNTKSADFLQGVRRALAGEAALPPKLAARLIDEFARLASRPAPSLTPPDPPDLTPREREVLALIATGATNKEIAAQLSLSLHTVKCHVRSILSKLQAANRRQVARLAVRAGWVSGEGQ
ncbi:MAG: response regulator transcription factor [Ardenticatenaceae bacterium]|nr:response regulator transcription factor [Ardenticatenaceae bacterium]HBY92671.1 DNA-binding response regulator [Chloroflexota bacterium]